MARLLIRLRYQRRGVFILKKMKVGIIVLFSMVLVACGRDVSTVEEALEGHWRMNDAQLNGEPLVELLSQNTDWIDIDESEWTTHEDGQQEMDVDYFYHEGLLTIVNSENEQTELPYEVISTNEENDSLTLEYEYADESIELTLQDELTFTGDERQDLSSNLNIVDVVILEDPTEELTELEQQWSQFGENIVLEIVKNINLEFSFDFVEETEAPVSENN